MDLLGNFDLGVFAILFCVALVAGFVDSIAGGGGMITIAALLSMGIGTHDTLGTNKLQSCFGSFSATLYFYRKGFLNLSSHIIPVIVVFIFALAGSMVVSAFDSKMLAKFIPFLLICFALYFLLSPKISEENVKMRVSLFTLYFVLGVIGFYDGFLGPGTGSFLMFALVVLGGFGMRLALAKAKLFNFTSNLASLLVFTSSGHILWGLGIVMGIGQFIGATLGSKVAIAHGGRIIKPLVVIVSIAVCARLIYNEYF